MELPLVRYGGALFLALHGLVHIWYVVLSQGWVEIEDEMGWNGQSWLLTGVLPQQSILTLGSVLYVLVTVGFVVGAVGLAMATDWWQTPVLVASVLSTVAILALWDGQFDLFVEKGFVGVALNVAIVAYLLVLD